MFLEVVLLSFVLAWLRGGSLKEDLGLRMMWLAPVAYALQVINRSLVPDLHLVVTAVSYGLLLYFAWVNIENQGVRFILIGVLLNVVVILANGGRIPVDIEAARAVGVDVDELSRRVLAKHAPLISDSRLPFLGDVIPVPFPIARIISLGDIFAVCGSFLLVQDLMGKRITVLRSEAAKD